MVSRWSESIYSDVLSPRTDGLSFLSQLDACLYEGIPMDDEILTNEANFWSSRFIHLRLVGKRIQPQPINVKCAEASIHLPTVNEVVQNVNNKTSTGGLRRKQAQFPRLNNRQKDFK